METLVSKALIIRLSLQPAPASETSAFNNMRAFSSRCAGLLPFRSNASSRSRSSLLSRILLYRNLLGSHHRLRRLCCNGIESQKDRPFKLIEANYYCLPALGHRVGRFE